MANGFGSLYVGQSGLVGAQNALNTTANNLANVNTKGYVRQQVRFADKTYNTLKKSQSTINLQQHGNGVSIGDVVHARDIFVDKAFRLETGREAFYSMCREVTSATEGLLQEMDGEEYAESIEDLYRAIEEMAKSPADSTNQNLLLQKCELFLSRSSALYSDLKSYQLNLNTQIKDGIDKVNELGARIYQLNLDVQKVESGKVETAMTLRDERDNLIDELSRYGRVEAEEDASGFTHVRFEGTEFVIERGCSYMDSVYNYDTGFYTPIWPELSNMKAKDYMEVYDLKADARTDNNSDIGSIKAMMIQRGDRFGTFEDLESEQAYRSIQSSTMMETEAELDRMYHAVVTMINDVFCPNKLISGDAIAGKLRAVSVPETDIFEENSRYRLIGAKDEQNRYYHLGLDDSGREMLVSVSDGQILDKENAFRDLNGELSRREIFVRNSYERYVETEVDGETVYVFCPEDFENPKSLYHIGTTRLNEELQKQVTKLGVYRKDGAVAYDLGQKLSNAWSAAGITLNPDDITPVNFEQFYNKVVGKLGTDGNIYRSANDTLTATVSALDNQRQRITGVSSDEELTNMVRFQSAYNASSRYMTVISQMTETIVTLI